MPRQTKQEAEQIKETMECAQMMLAENKMNISFVLNRPYSITNRFEIWLEPEQQWGKIQQIRIGIYTPLYVSVEMAVSQTAPRLYRRYHVCDEIPLRMVADP